MSDNDNLELKKRSRRRLVGAAALALIAAILLPMVMDDEPSAPANDIQVTIPDRSLDSRPIGMPGPDSFIISDPSLAESDGSSSVGAPQLAESAPEAEQSLRPLEPQASSRPATPPVASPTPSSPAAAPGIATPPTAKPEVRPSESAEEIRARAILEGRAGTVAPSTPAQQFVVQVGAFSDTGKASSRQIELAARGFRAYVETSDGVTRVRIGPYASRADAEAMLKKLKDASIDGVVSTR